MINVQVDVQCYIYTVFENDWAQFIGYKYFLNLYNIKSLDFLLIKGKFPVMTELAPPILCDINAGTLNLITVYIDQSMTNV